MGAQARVPVVATVVLLALAAVFAGGSDGLRPPGGLHLSAPHPTVSRSHAPTDSTSAARAPDRRSSTPDAGHHTGVRSDLRTALRWAFLALLAAGCLVAVAATLRITIVRRRDRRRIRPSPFPEAAGQDDVPPETLAEALEQGLADLDDGPVRNAVVAAWIRLEEHAERHGVDRHPEDTPTEFVTRALAAHLDPDALAELAALYLEARFSQHPIGEEQRRAARACLARLTRPRYAAAEPAP